MHCGKRRTSGARSVHSELHLLPSPQNRLQRRGNRRSREAPARSSPGARSVRIPQARRHARRGDQCEKAAAKTQLLMHHGGTENTEEGNVDLRESVKSAFVSFYSCRLLTRHLCPATLTRERQYF